MAKKNQSTKKQSGSYVVVTNRSYGNALKGTRIYFEGKRPTSLKDDGRIQFGKHILELLRAKHRKSRLIITEETDSLVLKNGVAQLRVSQKLLSRMNKENWDRSRDIKNDIVKRFFAIAYPGKFSGAKHAAYMPGTLASIVSPAIVTKLSSEDKDAVVKFLPDFVASESVGTVGRLKATAEIQTLKALVDDVEDEIGQAHGESWWQTYIKSNILLMQQGYIKALDKLNVAIGETKFPDFCLVTHDNYLDILEIKKPNTPMLRHDESRDNYYWDPEISKAISQTENYIEQISTKADSLRSHLRDKEHIDIKAVRPRGIILAGDAREFTSQKQRDDFRLLSQGHRGIIVVTYDELLARMRNYLTVLEERTKAGKKKSKGAKKTIGKKR